MATTTSTHVPTEQQMLRRLLGDPRLTSIVDIGANPVDGAPPYQDMLDAGLCTVTGFEPQADALAVLRARQGERETYLPHVVGDGRDHTLHVTVASGMTSLFPPDPVRLQVFEGFGDWGVVTDRLDVATTRLDDVEGLPAVDFLKIDVQGAELMVFEGGRDRLAETVVIQTEVSFLPLYAGQPTFGQIDVELRRQGFVPHAFAAVKQWPISPFRSHTPGTHQLLEADLVYVRDFARTEELSSDHLKQLSLVAHHVYGSSDLVVRCLLGLVAREELAMGSVVDYLKTVEA
ncbi:FkbM family methyltransferase [Kineococcus sp. R86509]|uniref:FkbM family methyltransferase n=1 Tax=Kineococcus sp. R86509 TaxID=3093851 RepID=UPI0036D23A1A